MAYADMDIFSLKNIDCHVIFVAIYVPYTVVTHSVIHSFLLAGDGGGEWAYLIFLALRLLLTK